MFRSLLRQRFAFSFPSHVLNRIAFQVTLVQRDDNPFYKATIWKPYFVEFSLDVNKHFQYSRFCLFDFLRSISYNLQMEAITP